MVGGSTTSCCGDRTVRAGPVSPVSRRFRGWMLICRSRSVNGGRLGRCAGGGAVRAEAAGQLCLCDRHRHDVPGPMGQRASAAAATGGRMAGLYRDLGSGGVAGARWRDAAVWWWARGGGADILSRLSADAGACVRPRRAVVHACYQRDRRHLRRLCPVLCRCDGAGIHSGRYSLWDMGAAVCDTGWCFRRACAGAGAWRGWRVVLRFPWTPCPGSGGGEAARARGGGSLSADSYRQGAGAGAAASARCDRQSGRRGGATGASFVLGAMHAAPRAARRGQSWQLELPSGLSIPVSKARVAACRAVGWL